MADKVRIIRNERLVKVPREDEKTIAVDDVTPDVAVGDVFVTSANTGPTAITDLDNARIGSRIYLLGGSSTNATTIADSGNFVLSAAITLNLNTIITLYIKDASTFVEMGRSVN